MPALPELLTALMKPTEVSSPSTPATVLEMMLFIVSMGLKPATSRAPTTMPMNSELYVSLVMRASTMATSGGTSDQNVPTNSTFPPI